MRSRKVGYTDRNRKLYFQKMAQAETMESQRSRHPPVPGAANRPVQRVASLLRRSWWPVHSLARKSQRSMQER
jgi:hypothetical protein